MNGSRFVRFTEPELRRLLQWYVCAAQRSATTPADDDIAERIETAIEHFDEFTVHMPWVYGKDSDETLTPPAP